MTLRRPNTRRTVARRTVKCTDKACTFGKGASAYAARRHAAETGHALTETRTYRIEQR